MTLRLSTVCTWACLCSQLTPRAWALTTVVHLAQSTLLHLRSVDAHGTSLLLTTIISGLALVVLHALKTVSVAVDRPVVLVSTQVTHNCSKRLVVVCSGTGLLIRFAESRATTALLSTASQTGPSTLALAALPSPATRTAPAALAAAALTGGKKESRRPHPPQLNRARTRTQPGKQKCSPLCSG